MAAKRDGYDDELYLALGMLVVSWSRAEYVVKHVVANMAGAGDRGHLLTGSLTTGRAIETSKSLLELVEDEDERDRLRDWLETAATALAARNRLFHGGWMSQGFEGGLRPARVAVSIKKGRVEHQVQPVTVDDVRSAQVAVDQVLGRLDDVAGYF